jgi:hypothetical protein
VSNTVICRICRTAQPINPRGAIKPHGDLNDTTLYCDGSLKPKSWGLNDAALAAPPEGAACNGGGGGCNHTPTTFGC